VRGYFGWRFDVKYSQFAGVTIVARLAAKTELKVRIHAR
jgi:hypothetical protein